MQGRQGRRAAGQKGYSGIVGVDRYLSSWVDRVDGVKMGFIDRGIGHDLQT